jgi:hypothetical protein
VVWLPSCNTLEDRTPIPIPVPVHAHRGAVVLVPVRATAIILALHVIVSAATAKLVPAPVRHVAAIVTGARYIISLLVCMSDRVAC